MSEILNVTMNEILKLIVIFVSFVVSKYVIPYLKNNIHVKQIEVIYSWAQTFVRASENMIKESGSGEEKLQMATDLLAKKLNSLNIKMSDEEIRASIEEAVRIMNTEN